MPPVSDTMNETRSSEETQPVAITRPRRIWHVLRWLLVLLVAAIALAAVVGYASGEAQRRAELEGGRARVADEQFQLALEDLAARRYEIAQQRLEYVIRIDPSYPNAAQRLAEALVGADSPLATLAPPATPTPNLAPVEDLFTQALAAYMNNDWDVTIDTLLALRAKDSKYRAVEVDGMMYSSLRNRGLRRIKAEGLLEEGLYDLSLAERFAPLDSEADEYRGWARMYVLANSFFGVNWAEAVYYFSQVYLGAPYITNDVYLKYATASRRHGDEYILANDPCGAMDLYYQSLLAWEDPDLVPTATEAWNLCEAAEAADAPPPATETPTPGGPPTETPTPTETPGG